MKAFIEVKETFDLSGVDKTIFPDYHLLHTIEDISKLPFNEEIANKSYVFGA